MWAILTSCVLCRRACCVVVRTGLCLRCLCPTNVCVAVVCHGCPVPIGCRVRSVVRCGVLCCAPRQNLLGSVCLDFAGARSPIGVRYVPYMCLTSLPIYFFSCLVWFHDVGSTEPRETNRASVPSMVHCIVLNLFFESAPPNNS